MPNYTAEELDVFSHTYSTHTAEVEGIDSYIFDSKIVIGKILAWNPHPDSDKLGLVDIDAGSQWKYTIVCGAENAKTAHYVPVALENATLPGWLIISRRPIRGIDSCGMICSLDELGLTTIRAEGIFPLESVWDEKFLEKHLWEPFGELTLTLPGYGQEIVYALNDVIFDLDNKFITNRPDLFSILGNAREIACIEKQDFKSPLPLHLSQGLKSPEVLIQTDKVINYFLSHYTISTPPETPLILQILLKRSNQGLHGLLPDLTNIVMTELGQPMHVFDADIIDGTISVRMAKKGEILEALDGKTYILSSDDMVIADEKKILAIAGIIGGRNSGATENTRNILLEAATFDPVSVRKTSQRLWIRTDSSIRFEKWVDTLLPQIATDRYGQLLAHCITDAKYLGNFIHKNPKKLTEIQITHSYIEERIGTQVSSEKVSDILTRLGFEVTTSKTDYTIIVPSWRDTGDVSIPADIVEEIARMVWYDTLPTADLPGPLSVARVHSHDGITTKISRFFAENGYFDAYTYPFTLGERFTRFSETEPAIIHNTSENRTHLRAHLAESLLELVASNYRLHSEGSFFEFGPIFDGEEWLQWSWITWWKNLEEIQTTLTQYVKTFFGIQGNIIQSETSGKLFAPHACGEILDDDKNVLVRFWLVRPTLLPLFDIADIEIYAFEIITLPALHRPIQFISLIEYPGTIREFNIIIPENTPVKTILDIVKESHNWISKIWVSEIYRDPTHIGEGKKSVVVSLLIQNPNTTITDEEAIEIQKTIIHNLGDKGYEIRGV